MTNSDDFKSEILEPENIETIKKIITQYFRVYDTRWSERMAAFYFSLDMDPDKLESSFEDLRVNLKTQGFIPRLARESGEHIIYVVRGPKIKKRNIWINILLIIATLFTTTWAGALLWFGRTTVLENEFDIITPLLNPGVVLFGFLSFALPLMLILGTHETAHYLAAKRHNIDASLPYFIPLPPPFILGTMGAFISMREPISNKKALLDIGAAGPIAGFLVSVPIVIIGFLMESMYPVTITELPSNVFVFNEPLLFAGLRMLFPGSENSIMHPTAFAGWVGLFVTALNLLPGGQLDGGHIARALFGNSARYLSLFVIIILFVLSFVTQFMLWIIFAFIILLLGTAHPPPLNDLTPLGPKRQAIGASCMVMLLLCIHYAPIIPLSIPDYDLEFDCNNCNQVVDINGTAFYIIEVTNTANEDGEINITNRSISINTNINDWNTDIEYKRSFTGNKISTNKDKKFELSGKGSFFILVTITPNQNVGYGGSINHTFSLTLSGLFKHTETYSIYTHVGTFDLNTTQQQLDPVPPGYIAQTKIYVKNLVDYNNTIDFALNFTPPTVDTGWNATVNPNNITLAPNGSTEIEVQLETPYDAEPGLEIELELIGKSRLNPQAYDTIELSVEISN